MDKTYKTVVQGEASESDEEEELNQIQQQKPAQPVVVEGEASESEEEELDTSVNNNSIDIPPLRLSQSHSSSMDSAEESVFATSSSPKHPAGRPRYDTILNKKLWESNLSLCNNLNGVVSQTYLSAAKELSNDCHLLTKSHAAIQDVSHHMRLLTNDLFHLDDRIDIIATCKLLPDIKLPPSSSSSPTQG